MRSQIQDRNKWRHVQDVAKVLGSVKTRQQKKLYKQVLPSKPSEAKGIFEQRYQQIVKSRKGQSEGIGALDDDTGAAMANLFNESENELDSD